MPQTLFRLLRDDRRGAAAVEYIMAVCVVSFVTWLAMSSFGQDAIKGLKLAGLDLLGLS